MVVRCAEMVMVEDAYCRTFRMCATSSESRRGSAPMRWPLGCGSFRGALLARARATSIAANIAEGCGESSNREFARFLDTSIKSANETERHRISARDFEVVSVKDWEYWNNETIEVRKMVFAYREEVLS